MSKESLIGCCGIIFVLGLVILIPISFSYIEYYEFGLLRRKSTGKIDTSKVYTNGRYGVGPDNTFLKYQADAHYEHFDQLGVFSASDSQDSIGLSFKVDIDFTYFLIQDEIGSLHTELAKSYKNVIISRTKDAIKNEAIFLTFNEYFQERKIVEDRFRSAVEARWNETPSVHAVLDQFHLGRIRIPDSVANKQLEARVQNERNDRESFLQQAEVERQMTAVEVNRISLEENKVLRTAQAEADLIRAKAVAEAKQLEANALNEGAKLLFEKTGISDQEHMTAFTYIRTLSNHRNAQVELNYLDSSNIVKTQSV